MLHLFNEFDEIYHLYRPLYSVYFDKVCYRSSTVPVRGIKHSVQTYSTKQGQATCQTGTLLTWVLIDKSIYLYIYILHESALQI